MQFVKLRFLKDGNIAPHTLDISVAFYIAEGEGIFAVNGKEIAVGTGDMATSEAGAVRDLTNIAEGDLKVLVIKQKTRSGAAIKVGEG